MRNLLTKKNAITNPLDTQPNFAIFVYQIAAVPVGTHVRAWSKLQECERRLEMYKWAQRLNDPAKAQHRVLLEDTVSAFLMTYEATIQFLKDQFQQTPNAPPFDSWITHQARYDVSMRGLRTLRHLEAHIEEKRPASQIAAVINETVLTSPSFHSIVREWWRRRQQARQPTGRMSNISRKWKLPELESNDLNKLRNSPLAINELLDWNMLVVQSDVESIFVDGLERLRDILTTAESVV